MALIEAKNLGVTFPVYGAAAMSIRNSLISQATGGKILSKENKIVNVDALSQISFTAKPGDRIGLTGHNGAGKSTLMRTLAGIYHPTTGKLKVRGKRASILSLAWLSPAAGKKYHTYEYVLRCILQARAANL